MMCMTDICIWASSSRDTSPKKPTRTLNVCWQCLADLVSGNWMVTGARKYNAITKIDLETSPGDISTSAPKLLSMIDDRSNMRWRARLLLCFCGLSIMLLQLVSGWFSHHAPNRVCKIMGRNENVARL